MAKWRRGGRDEEESPRSQSGEFSLTRPAEGFPVNVQLQPIDIRPDRWQKAGVIGSIINSLTVILLAIGLGLTYQANREAALSDATDHDIAARAQASDRFAKAVEQISSPEMEVRLGGIYSLQGLINDSPQDEVAASNVLSAFVRDHARNASVVEEAAGAHRLVADVQAAITVLGLRDKPLVAEAPADFQGAYLTGADFRFGNFTNSNFFRATLSYADFRNAQLQAADLVQADLTGAHLEGTALSQATLNGAVLMGITVDSKTVLPPGITVPST